MKHGKKLTMVQKIRIKSLKLNPEDWLVVEDCQKRFEIVHRISGENVKIGNASEKGRLS